MAMLATVRAPGESDATVTERLNAMFATEAERVANAAVLAEILVPMIAEQLRPPISSGLAAPGVSQPTVPATPLAPVPLAPRPAAPRPASIADFIDDMIAQESPPDRSGQGAQRRAS
jgi:hypothetical protein